MHVQSKESWSDYAAVAHWLGCFLLGWSSPLARHCRFRKFTLSAGTAPNRLVEDAIEDYLHAPCMLAARQQDPAQLKKQYPETRHVILRLTACSQRRTRNLYVVRELGQQRVWCAEALLSSATTKIAADCESA